MDFLPKIEHGRTLDVNTNIQLRSRVLSGLRNYLKRRIGSYGSKNECFPLYEGACAPHTEQCFSHDFHQHHLTKVSQLLHIRGYILIVSSHMIPSSSRSISLLSLRRPVLPSSNVLPPTTSNSIPSSDALDIAPKISSHPGLASTQVRSGPRNTFRPSHFKRKRRHGFMSRLMTKNGRKTLMRRMKKGRWNLSH